MPTDEQAQRSEVHEATGDASSSPVAQERGATSTPGSAPQQYAVTDDVKVIPEPPVDTEVIRDDTADGGPLVIESNDPDLKRRSKPGND
ncbi:MAG TPA: hypothetical protein VGN72_15515 [Tepidisphaeraceae bacterium]|jgi:hypothetical protein|nr:hypothetical protein [Tepidisphaeraceae bacterium]